MVHVFNTGNSNRYRTSNGQIHAPVDGANQRRRNLILLLGPLAIVVVLLLMSVYQSNGHLNHRLWSSSLTLLGVFAVVMVPLVLWRFAANQYLRSMIQANQQQTSSTSIGQTQATQSQTSPRQRFYAVIIQPGPLSPRDFDHATADDPCPRAFDTLPPTYEQATNTNTTTTQAQTQTHVSTISETGPSAAGGSSLEPDLDRPPPTYEEAVQHLASDQNRGANETTATASTTTAAGQENSLKL